MFNISYGRWGVEGLLSEWMMVSPEPYLEYSSSHLRGNGYRISEDTLQDNCLQLIRIGLFLRFISYLLLVWVDRNKQNKVYIAGDNWCNCLHKNNEKTNDTNKLNTLKHALAARTRSKTVGKKGFAFNVFRDQQWLTWKNKRNIIDDVYFSKYDKETKKFIVGIKVQS